MLLLSDLHCGFNLIAITIYIHLNISLDFCWSLKWYAISHSSQCSTNGVTNAVVCYPVCGMVHIKEHLVLNRKSSPCGSSRFPLSLSEWSFTICLTPYNRKYSVLSVSLNKTFPSFLPTNGMGQVWTKLKSIFKI